MNINLSESDIYKLSMASKIGQKKTGDFVAINKKTIKCFKDNPKLLMITTLDNQFGEELFSFFSLNAFLSITKQADTYELKMDSDKYKSVIKTPRGKYTLPILKVNEYSRIQDLDPTKAEDPIYMRTGIENDQSIVEDIKDIKNNCVVKFSLSKDFVQKLIKDSNIIKANQINFKDNNKEVHINVFCGGGDDINNNDMKVDYNVDGTITGGFNVTLPINKDILQTDIDVYIKEDDVLIIDTEHNIKYLLSGISDIDMVDLDINFDESEIEFEGF